MIEWEFMFKNVQTIVWAAKSVEDGLQKLIEFAPSYPYEKLNPEYWQQVSSTPMPFETLKTWANEGFEKLETYPHPSMLMLNCGDAPDVFIMTEWLFSEPENAGQFEDLAKGKVLIDSEDCTGSFGGFRDVKELSLHYVRELNHPILSGDDSYLLWLTLASLVTFDLMKDSQFCRQILKGREKIIVIIGFEEIFYYLGTITDTIAP